MANKQRYEVRQGVELEEDGCGWRWRFSVENLVREFHTFHLLRHEVVRSPKTNLLIKIDNPTFIRLVTRPANLRELATKLAGDGGKEVVREKKKAKEDLDRAHSTCTYSSP